MDLNNLAPVTPEQIVAQFESTIQAPEVAAQTVTPERLADLEKMSKPKLIELIVAAESKPPKGGTRVAELVKAILKNESFITADHTTIATAVQALLPGSKTTAKSVASYISKNGADWEILPRIALKTPKPKVTKVEETPLEQEEPVEA